MTDAISSSETSVLTSATRRHISEEAILHSQSQSVRNMFPVRYELCFISHEPTFFIVTAVETSNLTEH
jgi:hypothetical protein